MTAQLREFLPTIRPYALALNEAYGWEAKPVKARDSWEGIVIPENIQILHDIYFPYTNRTSNPVIDPLFTIINENRLKGWQTRCAKIDKENEALEEKRKEERKKLVDERKLVGRKKSRPHKPPLLESRFTDYRSLAIANIMAASTRSNQHSLGVPQKRNIINWNYQMTVMLADLADEQSLLAWMKIHLTKSQLALIKAALPTYIHGILFEGIHFNRDRREEALKLMVHQSVPKASKSRSKRDLCAKAERVITKVGRFTLTSMDCHAEFRLHGPKVTVDDNTLVGNWRKTVLNNVSEQMKETQSGIESLNKKLMNAERSYGQLCLVYDAAVDASGAKIKETIDRLRTIPELATFEPTAGGFSVTTKDMIGYSELEKKEKYVGRFEIQVNLTGHVRVRNIASPRKNFRNFHGNCVGSFGRAFGMALSAFDYYTLILTVMEYYRYADRRHNGLFTLLPDSLTPPATTYVSEWHDLVGDFIEETIDSNDEQTMQLLAQKAQLEGLDNRPPPPAPNLRASHEDLDDDDEEDIGDNDITLDDELESV